jgi:hypothetical protein
MRDRSDWQTGRCHYRAYRGGFHTANAREIKLGSRGGAGKYKNLRVGRGNHRACCSDGDLGR